MSDIVIRGKCRCGAVEMVVEGESYCAMPKKAREVLGVSKLPRAKCRYSSCNHCVNNWGLDLCACGSGEPPELCKEGFSCCGEPSQVLEVRTRYRASDAWGA